MERPGCCKLVLIQTEIWQMLKYIFFWYLTIIRVWTFTQKTFFLFFWRFHWSDEHMVLLMRMLHWFPERGCKYGLVSSFQRCYSK
jgi:hypothetical protein